MLCSVNLLQLFLTGMIDVACAHTHTATMSSMWYRLMILQTPPPSQTLTLTQPIYIAIASSAAGRAVTFTEDIGDGRSGTLVVPGGSDIVFNNRAVGGGTKYFFVRLYSSVVSL